CSSWHLYVGPRIVAIVCLGMMYGMLCDFERGRIGFRGLLWLILLSIVWTNVHGGILGGLATMMLAWAGWSLYRVVGWESPFIGFRQIVSLALVIIACGLAILINPYGLDLPRAWQIVMKADLQDLMIEHDLLVTSISGVLVIIRV